MAVCIWCGEAVDNAAVVYEWHPMAEVPNTVQPIGFEFCTVGCAVAWQASNTPITLTVVKQPTPAAYGGVRFGGGDSQAQEA